MKYYTGVGSRKTPPEIITVMSGIAYYLANTANNIIIDLADVQG